MQEIFQQMVGIFHELDNINNILFARIIAILETVAKVRSCVLMLDLQCDDLILKMFNTFFSIARYEILCLVFIFWYMIGSVNYRPCNQWCHQSTICSSMSLEKGTR